MLSRVLELILAFFISALIVPVIIVVAVLIWIFDGRPLFYVAPRVKRDKEIFDLYKFRTMLHDPNDDGASGGYKDARVTVLGSFLRKYRIDELPQIFNVFRGDITFVGPRPPLKKHVDLFPDLFAPILEVKPGITGLATLKMHKYEKFVLQTTMNLEENEARYNKMCIPKKTTIDKIYVEKRNMCLDVSIICQTLKSLI